MIYTIGHRQSYLDAIADHGVIVKMPGGYAFNTIDDALRRIEEENEVGNWCVWGLEADWCYDTEPDPTGWWHLLNKEANIIQLEFAGW